MPFCSSLIIAVMSGRSSRAIALTILPPQSSTYGINMDQLDYTQIEAQQLNFPYHDGTAVNIIGGPQAASGHPQGAQMRIFAGATAQNQLTFNVAQGGNLIAEDIWYECDCGNWPGFLTGSGPSAIALQGMRISVPNGYPQPPIWLNNFTGNATFAGLMI